MKPQLPNTISDALPNFYRARGGALLDVLLQRIDHNWCQLGLSWTDVLGHTNCEGGSRELLDVMGWSHILALAGSHITNPKMLAEVATSGPPGSEPSIRFWLKYLFDCHVETVVIERETWAAANPKVVVNLTKPRPATDFDLVLVVLKTICPAHLEVDKSSLVWINEKGMK